jgi:hypothetical protein
MILRLMFGIALGIKIAQDSLFSWHTAEIVGIAIVLQAIDRRVSLWLG